MRRIQTASLQNIEGQYKNTPIVRNKRPHFLMRLLAGWRRLWRSRPESLPPSASLRIRLPGVLPGAHPTRNGLAGLWLLLNRMTN